MVVGAKETLVIASELKAGVKRIKQLEGAWATRLWMARLSRSLWTLQKKNGLRAYQYCYAKSRESFLLCAELAADPVQGESDKLICRGYCVTGLKTILSLYAGNRPLEPEV